MNLSISDRVVLWRIMNLVCAGIILAGFINAVKYDLTVWHVVGVGCFSLVLMAVVTNLLNRGEDVSVN